MAIITVPVMSSWRGWTRLVNLSKGHLQAYTNEANESRWYTHRVAAIVVDLSHQVQGGQVENGDGEDEPLHDVHRTEAN